MQGQVQQRILDRMATSNKITPKQYAAMILREDFDMTFEQIGKRLDIHRATAYLLYIRGKRNETISKDIFQVFRVR